MGSQTRSRNNPGGKEESNFRSNEARSGNNVWNPHLHLWGKKLQAEGGGPDRVKEYVCARKSSHGKMGLPSEVCSLPLGVAD